MPILVSSILWCMRWIEGEREIERDKGEGDHNMENNFASSFLYFSFKDIFCLSFSLSPLHVCWEYNGIFLFSPLAISVCLIFNFNTICILSERERDLLFTQQAQTFLHLLLMSGQTPEGCKRNLYSLSGNF